MKARDEGPTRGRPRASGNMKKLLGLRSLDPPCVCGKERFYSQEAAEKALEDMAPRRMIQLGQVSERAVYLCKRAYPELGIDVWHLTSNTGYERNTEAKAAMVERQQQKRELGR